MINTEQQLGSPSGHSAAAILAAALACTSASNSPPELFSLTTTSSTQLANPFSPGIAQIAAAASPLNPAAVQQLANAHQLAAAIYNSSMPSSIPSPGGSAFAARQHHQPSPAVTVAAAAVAHQLAAAQHHHNQQQQQQSASVSAQFGPTSPAAAAFAHLEQLARLKAVEIAAATTVANSTLDICGGHQQQQFYPVQPSPNGLAALATQLQQQAQALESASKILGMTTSQAHHQHQHHQLHHPHISLQHQQQLVAAALQQQQQQQQAVQQLQQQQQQAAITAITEQSHQQQQQHVQGNLGQSQRHPSGSGEEAANPPQPLPSSSSASSSGCTEQQQQQDAQGQPVRRIRRRRPKEEPGGQRRNSVGSSSGGKRRNSGDDKSMDSPPQTGGGGPLSVQPATPGGDLLVPKMEEEPIHQPPPSSSSMLVTSAPFPGAASIHHNDMVEDNSPPSLEQPKLQRESRRQSLEDADGRAGLTKTCRVCGDSATGYNFNVISCESCKAFFRRNALRPKEFKCPYANECEINAVSRRFCQKCRLRKCFTVGMKKEWILSDDQLRRRKNARIKNSMMGSNGKEQPKTPSSNGSMAPSTPFGGPPSNALSNSFSPPQHQQQQFFQQQQQPSQPHQFAAAAAAALLQQGQTPSPLALAAAAAITKLASSPKQLSPGGSLLGLDGSPLTAFGIGNSPPETKAQPPTTLANNGEQPKVSPSGAHSPPPILPAVSGNAIGQQQQYEQNVLRLAQQQLLQQAQLQQAAAVLAQRRPSDSAAGLLSLAPTLGGGPHQQQSPNSSSLSPLVEQYHRLMMLGNQQQQAQAANNENAGSSSLLLTVQPPSAHYNQKGTEPAEISPQANRGAAGMPAENMHGTTTTTTSSSSITSLPAGSGLPNFMNMDASQRERLMQMRMQRTIQEELGSAMSPPDTARCSPGVSGTAPSSKAPTPGAPTPDAAESAEFERALERERKLTISRQYQLNSLEQRQMDAVKAAFASMDEELKMELMRNAKFMGIMMKEQTQSPADMMCLLDVIMRRFVKLAKRLSSFNELSPGGKFSLLKAAMMDLLTLRGASRLDAEKRCWKSPLLNTEIKCKIDMFDQLNDSMQKRRVMDFYKSLHDKLKTDQVANNLIVVTVLFTHFTDTELSAEDRALAEKHYYSHNHLLERYLQSVYGPEEAKEIYDTVPDALVMLKDVTRKVHDLFPPDKIDRKEAEGTLFKEFFHIKPATSEEGATKKEAEEDGGGKTTEENDGDEKMEVDAVDGGTNG